MASNLVRIDMRLLSELRAISNSSGIPIVSLLNRAVEREIDYLRKKGVFSLSAQKMQRKGMAAIRKKYGPDFWKRIRAGKSPSQEKKP